MSFPGTRGDASQSARDDRRRAERKGTFREVLFSGTEAQQLLREGTLVDFSVRGAQIHTRQPEPEGTLLDIELYREGGATKETPQLMQARVMWVEPLPSGDYALGVSFQMAPGKPPSGTGVTRSAETPDGSPEQVPAPTAGAEVRFRPRPPDTAPPTRKRRFLLIALALLLLLLLLLSMALKHGTTLSGGAADGGASGQAPQDTAPAQSSGLGQLWQPVGGYATPAHLLAAADSSVAAGQLDAAKGYYQRVLRHTAANPTERLQANMGYARMLGLSGERAHGDAVLSAALTQTHDAPTAWLDAARGLQSQLHNPAATLDNKPEMVDALVLAPSESASSGGPLKIVVNRKTYLMTISRGGTVLRTYPIGLGRNEATPAGAFQIANKITDPDWFNRGEVVKAGDPANPLGKRWMGLGKDGTATSYGIHPTPDQDSIGQPQSRGCIRMRPADADAVFRLCPLGTAVLIED